MHKGIKLPCHFNKATLYTTFRQRHCAERWHPVPSRPGLSWLCDYTSILPVPLFPGDGVRMSWAQLAISDVHASEQISTQLQPCSRHSVKLSLSLDPLLSSASHPLLAPTPPHTQTHTYTITHTLMPREITLPTHPCFH